MSLVAPLQHELDLDRHAGELAPDQPVPNPKLGSELELDPAVIRGAKEHVDGIDSANEKDEQRYQSLALR